jgi:hypothetical protein
MLISPTGVAISPTYASYVENPNGTEASNSPNLASSSNSSASTLSSATSTTLTATPINTPHPTYTISPPTAAPFVTPVPDTNYVQQAHDRARDELQAQVNALPPLNRTITGTLASGLIGGRINSEDGGLTLGLRPGIVPVTNTINVQMSRVQFPLGDRRSWRNGQRTHIYI